jgi:cell division protease FtsH
MAEIKKPEPKKAQSLLFLLATGLFLLMLFQTVFGTKTARVSFSYQLEHLVNLDVLQPEDSRKTATQTNLVTFSGRFREARTEVGKQRFRYLELIEEQNSLHLELSRLEQEMDMDRRKVVNAATLFLGVSGIKVPHNGYQVFSEFFDTPDHQNHIIIRDVPDTISPTFASLYNDYEHDLGGDEQKVSEYLKGIQTIVASLRSPLLGIGNEAMKKSLRDTDVSVQAALTTPSSKAARLETLKNAFAAIQNVIDGLDQAENHIRLHDLRSVRDYAKCLDQYSELIKKIEENSQRLERSLQPVVNYVWFFNNEEVSSRDLAKQPPEAFHQWFVAAKEEWSSFENNKGAVFKAPDQPLNKVLEKTFKSEELPTNYVGYFLSLAPLLLILFLLYLAFSRQVKGMGGNPMDFGRSPARLYPKGSNPITFKDVAGIDDALEELQEIVEFLKNPQKFTSLGGKIPKGVLCVGPPGTGKTLIAKAVAGEADCPFFSISGSDFVEMFVGVGASRIRKMFEDAKKNAPCIIFIDEIDAVGRHRGAGIGGGHDEREQTLNQLLVEMDGFDTQEGIIIIAATNRPDVLDKALLRPGRFDRQVVISLPDIKGRYEILKVHARKIKLDDSVDLMVLAKSTPGSSGADLANMLNEAALLAARRNRSAVTMDEIYEARDKVLYGKERRNLELDKQEKRSTAYHESGHAVVGAFVEHIDPIDKVTIIPRGFSLGSTMVLPKKNRVTYWKRELIDQLAFLMGGRASEEVFVHDISNGAKNDIERATQLARSMVCEWGMSDKLGAMTYDERTEGGQYLGLGGYHEKMYSEMTAEEIDREVRQLIDAAYERAKSLVKEHKDQIELMTEMLLEFETLDAEDVEKIVKGTWNTEEKREKLKILLEKNKKLPPPLPKEALEGSTDKPAAPEDSPPSEPVQQVTS